MTSTTQKFLETKGNFMNDPTVFKQFFKVWFHLAFYEKDFETQVKHQLKMFSFYTPNLVDPTTKGLSNPIIENDQALNPKLFDTHHRKFKHILREQYPEQRP